MGIYDARKSYLIFNTKRQAKPAVIDDSGSSDGDDIAEGEPLSLGDIKPLLLDKKFSFSAIDEKIDSLKQLMDDERSLGQATHSDHKC
ncbi:hypothetical protein NDU88_002547 [Pleurodeles waltl]|uniref:Uncharacterized protein n=1 Tax=Pleurodeles waltl TaxID=8319 RepID=A0AAV7VZN1_PLEWA|nr:hypothetical protein NDU88_002547 [Pleurodeles waltl]